MEYTFKEAFDEIDEKAFYIEKDETWANVSSSVFYLVKDLQETYAPKIGLTKLGKERLFYYIETSNLPNFMEYAYNNMQLYNGVSWEELAQAWLHPENIEIVG